MPFSKIDLSHIPKSHLMGIGLVNQAWAYLEGAIERICWLMSEVPSESIGQALTTHMTHRSRYDAALALVSIQFPGSEAHSALKTLGSKITGELAAKRNSIAHSRLHGFKGIDATFRTTYKARGAVKAETSRVTEAEYEEVVTDLVETTNKVIDIFNDLAQMVEAREGASPPWLRRPTERD